MKAKQWMEEELNLLRDIYPTSTKEILIASFPNRTIDAIKSKATFLKLKKKVGFYGKKHWSEKDIQSFKKEYANVSNIYLAKKHKCSVNSITHLSNKLGLKKSKEFLSSMVSKQFLEAGKKTRFNPGNVPISKGKMVNEWMSAEGIEKMKATQFKKGNVPHNHLPIGSERISSDGYVHVKFQDVFNGSSKKNYKAKHRFLWEKEKGPIPKGMNVEFIDGDKMNITIENLVLRSRKENMLNNALSDDSIIKKMLGVKEPKQIELIKEKAPQIIELKRNQIKLNQKIKKSCKNN